MVFIQAVDKLKMALRGKNDCRWNDLEYMTGENNFLSLQNIFWHLVHCSGFTHTGPLENFNSLHNKYMPKSEVFSHEGALVRTALTAIGNLEYQI